MDESITKHTFIQQYKVDIHPLTKTVSGVLMRRLIQRRLMATLTDTNVNIHLLTYYILSYKSVSDTPEY